MPHKGIDRRDMLSRVERKVVAFECQCCNDTESTVIQYHSKLLVICRMIGTTTVNTPCAQLQSRP